MTEQEDPITSFRQCLEDARDSVDNTVAMSVEAMSGLNAVLHCESLEDARLAAMSALIKAGHHAMPSEELAVQLRMPQSIVDAVLLSHHDEGDV